MREIRRCPTAGLLAAFWLALAIGSAAYGADPVEFFEAKVRPVLVESCEKCHGAKKQASGLRLDSREALLEGGLNGPAVVPGEPDNSLLVQAVRQTHEDIKMPPKGRLPAPAVEALAAWVKMGAPWPKAAPKSAAVPKSASSTTHWAFRPVKPVTVPKVSNPGWVRTPVDAFILARLDAAKLRPSPGADRRTLIRRVTFDLTGLPPTPEEVAAFDIDTADNAYERLVDRLLASKAYGERWGRHWLDVARYADTKGYVFQEDRRYPYSYTYRDYVIRSFNEDLPYDRFLTEQIAADRLGPGTDARSLAALGFLTVGRRYLNNNEDIIDDRIDVVTRGLLGLTVSCARCHDHKFDPIPTDDYYSLHGVFASSVEPQEPPEIPASVPAPLVEDYKAKLAASQKAIDDFVIGGRAEVLGDLRGRIAVYLRAGHDLEFKSSPSNDPKLNERAAADKLSPSRLRGFKARWGAKLDASRGDHDPVFKPWHDFAALPASEFATKAAGVARALAGDPKASNPVVASSFAGKPPATMADVVARYGELLTEAARKWDEAAKTGAKGLGDPAWEALRQVLFADAGPVTIPADQFIDTLEVAEKDKLTALRNALADLKTTHPGSPPRAMVLNDAPNPVQPRVYIRGNPGRPGNEVPRRFLKVLSGPDRKPFAEGSGRLGLARAIADKSNPLTARVMVNRVWMHHFGTGLVNTASDFGVRCEKPSHPDLLDWLAADFVDHKWSVKSLHRRIVLSNTYRQRSDFRADALARDPSNRLYWKMNRHRLEFEAMRDALLAVSGSLDPTMGGRSVPINDPPFPPRRTVYGYIDRLGLDGEYRTFDFASPDVSSPRRLSTTVPQQALFLMNSPFVIGQARALAGRAEVSQGAAEVRVRRLYLRLFGRPPDARELALGVGFVRKQDAAGPSLPPPPWSYGLARLEPSTVTDFRPFAHWTGKLWQSGATMPDPQAGYSQWHDQGGHAGPDDAHTPVLRWTAPRDLVVKVEATLGHAKAEGDGVRGLIVSTRGGPLGEWLAHNAKVPTPLERREVKRGESLDFVIDRRKDDAHDSFTWAPVIREDGGAGEKWDASGDFHGPTTPGLSPWEEYAQVLMLTNEFVFVD